MARADGHSPLARRDAAADLSGVDLILECERAASRRNRRELDPKRWSRQLGAATFTQQPAAPRRLQRIFGR